MDAYTDAHTDGNAYAYAYTDGNELGGPLSEIFVPDITAAGTLCAHCGRSGPMASLELYSRAPGWVARCPACGEVVLRLVRGPASAWLDLSGTRTLQISMPAAGA